MQGATSTLGREDYVSFLNYLANKKCLGKFSEEDLVRRYFHPSGTGEHEYFKGVAHRAYLDFNRTLRGIAKHAQKSRLHDEGISALWDFSMEMRKTLASI